MKKSYKYHAFITGGSGFTGNALIRTLLKKGHKITALVRKTSNTSNLEKLGIKIVVGDLRDKSSFRSSLKGIDVIYHIAAAFREVRLSNKDYYETNVLGTKNIIEAAADAGVIRFVHCSTIGVHGDTGSIPATEESPFSPPDYYCETKLEGELLARELFEKLGIKGSVFRPLGIYGPGDNRFLKLFHSIKRKRFFMIGNGEVWYHMTYIDDLCEGIILCGEKEKAVGQVFILGGEKHVSLNELVAEIAAAVGKELPKQKLPYKPILYLSKLCENICKPFGLEPPLYERRLEFFSKNRAADISKVKRMLEFSPKFTLSEGIARTARWYEEHGWL